MDDVHPADLVPGNPSDWLKFDEETVTAPEPTRSNFNCSVYGREFIADRYDDPSFVSDDQVNDATVPWLSSLKTDKEGTSCQCSLLLYNTARLLKEGGNQALNEGSLQTAARRYDKAIQYCAVAFMNYDEGSRILSHIDDSHFDILLAKRMIRKKMIAV